MKKLIISGIAVVFVWLMYQYPKAMLNPGELVEGHQNLKKNCNSCHEPFRGISNNKCITCHKLSEIGKDTSNGKGETAGMEKILFHQGLSDQKCSSCHTEHIGLKPEMPLSSFDHSLLSEPFISKCAACHKQPADNRHEQFSSECKSCHNTGGWKSGVKFDHAMINGDAKNNCASCHQKPDDSFHNLINDNCNKCHSTSKWIPSSFDHTNYFILDKDHNTECKTCHTNNNFSTYTCFSCHEHSESNMLKEHSEEGINDISKCADCHKSGNEHDIRMNRSPGNGTINNGSDNKENQNRNFEEKDREKNHKKNKKDSEGENDENENENED